MTGAEPTGDEIQRSLVDGVLRITLNRPDAGNAITNAQRDDVVGWLRAADGDPNVRCVVIGAVGRFFCTGPDLREPGAVPEDPGVGDIRRHLARGTQELMRAVLDCEKPVIAKVQGTAAGNGAHLAFCCDFVICGESARFIEVFVRRGLAVDGLGTYLLPRMIGLLRAKELVLLGDDVSAARAEAIGLATRVVPDDSLDQEVDELAARLATGPTKALAADKWLLNRSLDLDRSAMEAEEAWVVEAVTGSEDAAEGVASFVERRPSRYTGR